MLFRRTGHNQDEPTSLYVLECAGRVKIGIAANVAKRVEHLQLACPIKITVAHERRFPTRTLARLAERSLHAKHSEVRLWGEWFEMDVEVAIAAVVAVEERAPAVAIPTGTRQLEPLVIAPPEQAEPRPRYTPESGRRATWDEMNAMSDEEWCEYMRPLAELLDFEVQ